MRTLVGRPVGVDSSGNPVYYREIAGSSGETKPVGNIATGSWFHEVDTKKVYSYLEGATAGQEWVEQLTLSEG